MPLYAAPGFKQRISVRDYDTRTRGLELVFDLESAAETVRLLSPMVGRTEVGRLIDSPWTTYVALCAGWYQSRDASSSALGHPGPSDSGRSPEVIACPHVPDA